jgi:subtilisin family serine protease
MDSLPSESLASLDMINISQAHALSSNHGEGITVAVIDTGIDLSHPAFEGRLAPTSQWRDLVDNDQFPQDEIAVGAKGVMYGHGTAAAGLIAQVAPKAKILPIRVLDADGRGTVLNLAIGLYYAIIYGADVINISVGTDSADATLQSFITYAASRFAHVVVASGNAGRDSLDYPAAFANFGSNEGQLISVGSVNRDSERSRFTNYGAALEFLTPGEGVFSSYPDNRVGYFSGTSFASPIVAGMIALGLAEAPGTSSFETYLASGAEAVSGWGNGYGIPKADHMLEAIMAPAVSQDSPVLALP